MLNDERKISPVPMGTNVRKNSSTIRTVKEEILYLSKSIELSECTFEDENGKSKSAEIIRKRYMVDVNADDVPGDTILSIAILKRHILCDCLILVRQYRPTLRSYALEFPARIIEQSANDTGFMAMKEMEESTGFGSAKIAHISPETSVDPELCDSKVKLVSMIIDGDDPIKNKFVHSKKKRKNISNNNHNINNNLNNNLNDKIKIINNTKNNLNSINNNNTNNNNQCTSITTSSNATDVKKEENINMNNNNAHNEMNNLIDIISVNNDANNDDEEEEDDDIEIIFLPINGLLDRLNEYFNQGTIVDSRVYAFAIGLKKGEKLSQTTVKPENIEIAI